MAPLGRLEFNFDPNRRPWNRFQTDRPTLEPGEAHEQARRWPPRPVALPHPSPTPAKLGPVA
jgi:hypothetical protein